MHEEYRIPVPPDMVYDDHPSKEVFKEAEATPLFTIKKIDYPPEGGIFIYYEELLFPKKGFPYPEGVWAVNIVKRVVISTVRLLASKELIPVYIGLLLMPRKKKAIARLLELIDDCLDVVDAFLYTPRADNNGKSFYLKAEYFMAPAKELARYAMLMLKFLGIEDMEFLQKVGRMICMVIEYDTAYCLRIQDILSEVDSRKLMADPRKEIARLFAIYCQREKMSVKVKESFGLVTKVLRIIFLIPKIKTAFLKATQEIDFSKIAFTEADRYQVSFLGGYDFMGKTPEERIEYIKNLHGGIVPKGPFNVKVQ
jgi:hypothetical protein